MNQYKIVAYENDGVELDTYGDDDISLNYQIDDILDVAKRNTSFSKTIKLPGTPKNNLFFKGIFDVNIDGIYFNPTKRIPVVVKVGPNDVMNGYLQLMNILINNGEVNYEVSIAGSLKNIMTTISDYKISDLDFSEFNHHRTQGNIIASWDYNVRSNGDLREIGGPGTGYVYPYIINGNSTGIWNTIYVHDMYPALYVKTVIDKLFNFAGFTYTSKFFESEYFKKLILPFNGDTLQLTDEQVKERTTIVGLNSQYNNITPWLENGSSWHYTSSLGLDRESGTVNDLNGELTFTDDLDQWSNSVFTCEKTGYYDLEFDTQVFIEYKSKNNQDFRWQKNSLEYLYSMRIIRANGGTVTIDSSGPGGQLATPTDGNIHQSPWKDTENVIGIHMQANGVVLDAGDKVVVTVGHRHPGAVGWVDGAGGTVESRLVMAKQLDGSYSRFSIEPSNNAMIGNEEINMNQILDSNLKMKDFLTDIMKMFNLVLQDNPSKGNDVLIEPRDDFFKSRKRVLNWDKEKKLDNDSEVRITPMSELDFKTYRYEYAQDSDFYNKEYSEETGRRYGDFEMDVDNDFSDKTNKLELKFAATPNGQQFIDSRVAPFFVDYDGDNFKPKKVKPRILFYGGRVDMYSGSKLYVRDFEGQPNAQSSIVESYPYCGMWDHPTNPMYDLSFGRTNKIYWDSNGVFPNQNLFERFHKQTMMNIVSLNSRLLECSVHLTPKDIAEFDFRDVVFLLGSYWRVNKIKDYNPSATDRLTKVVLYKIIDIEIIDKYTVGIPTSNGSCPSDMITKTTIKGHYIASKSGAPISEDCCKQVGGTYIDGLCRVSTIRPVTGTVYAGPSKIVGPFKPIGGLGVVPRVELNGPAVLTRYGTTRTTIGIPSIGSGNFIPGGLNSGVIIGNNSSIIQGVDGSVVIGDGITGTEAGTVYIGGIKISQDRHIRFNGLNIIDGGKDEVLNYMRTNNIDIVDGTIDSVRNIGGASKARPIIDGNDNPGF